MRDPFEITGADSKDPPCRCVVKLTTTHWKDANGVYTKKSLKYLKRKCVGFNIIDEDATNGGPEFIFPKIVNLHECQDGVYEVITCNEFSCWETPSIIEDYDYKLIPIK